MYFLSSHPAKLYNILPSKFPMLYIVSFLQVISPSRKKVTAFQIRVKIKT